MQKHNRSVHVVFAVGCKVNVQEEDVHLSQFQFLFSNPPGKGGVQINYSILHGNETYEWPVG